MSSRNANLTTLERSNAPKLYKGLCKGQTEITNGVRSAKKIQQIIYCFIKENLTEQIEYVEVIDKETLERIDTISRPIVIASAVRLSKTRLIDNIIVSPSNLTTS